MQNIGERLEEARKRKGISIREAAEATKIRSDYLHKFESNQFDLGLAEIYVRGFLRNYANFLKLPADKILNDYSALGRGETRPRQPNREIYGRMDVSVASAEERPAENTSPAGEPRSAESVRTPHNIIPPKGPIIPPQWVFKGGIALGGVIILILLIWIIKALIGGPTPTPVSGTPPATIPGTVQSSDAQQQAGLTLIALNTVRVKVVQESNNQELYQGTLVRGQTHTVPKRGALLITADAGKNLEIEIAGRRYPMPFEDYNQARVP